jgi:hypothetical protein
MSVGVFVYVFFLVGDYVGRLSLVLSSAAASCVRRVVTILLRLVLVTLLLRLQSKLSLVILRSSG